MDKSPKKIDIDVKFSAYDTIVRIDDVPVPYVKEVQVIHRAGEAPRVIIEIVPEGDVHIMGESYVYYKPPKVGFFRRCFAVARNWRES